MSPIMLTMLLLVGWQGISGSQGRSAADDQMANSHYRSGWESMAAESWAEAAREFKAAIDLNPQFKLAYYGLGRANMGLKRFPDAALAYEKCRDTYVSQASRNFASKSEADRMLSDDVMQIDMALSRLLTAPQTPQIQAQIAQMQGAKQRLQVRTRGMDSMSLTSPVPAFVLLALGSAYFRAERFADAEREYKATLAVDPKSGETHNNLAVVYLMTERYAEAEQALKAAERAGYRVNPNLKDEINKKKRGGGD
jgi:tetratricopeptide (TPR) repeat protein